MTLKRHVKQPDKKITNVRVEPLVDANVQTARSEYTPAIGAPDANIRADVQTSGDTETKNVLSKPIGVSTDINASGDTEAVERLSKPLNVSSDVQQANDTVAVAHLAKPQIVSSDVQTARNEITPTFSTPAPQINTDIQTATDVERIARLTNPVLASTEVNQASDTERTAKIAQQPIQVSREIQSARNIVTATPGNATPMVKSDVQTADDTPRTLRITKPLEAKVEVQQSRDVVTPTAKSPEPNASQEVIAAPDVERVARITQPRPINTEVIAAPDVEHKLVLQHKPIPTEIIASDDAPSHWKSFEDEFAGAWLPKGDPVRIGQKNYATLENFRYTDFGIEGVNGHTKINTTNPGYELTNGIQLRTNYTQESYVIVQGTSSSTTPKIMQNMAAVPATGDFDSYAWTIDNTNQKLYMSSCFGGITHTAEILVNEATYYSGSTLATAIDTALNASDSLTHSGSMSFNVSYSSTTHKFTITATGGTVGYTDASSTMGDEIGFTTNKGLSASIVSDTAVTHDSPLYSETSNTSNNTARFSLLPRGQVGVCNQVENLIWAGDEMPVGAFLYGTEKRIVINASNNNLEFTSGTPQTATITLANTSASGITGAAIASDMQTKIRAAALTLPNATVEFRLGKFYIDAGSGKTILFTGVGDAAYTVGFIAATTAARTMISQAPYVGSPYFQNLADYTEIMNNTLTSTGNTATVGNSTDYKYFLVGSTRPIKGLKITTTSGAFTTGTLSGTYFNGYKMNSITNLTVTTASSVDTVTFDDTSSDAKPILINGYYLFFYRFELSTGSVTISHITLNAIMQNTVDLWDGIYRTCTKFIFKKYESSKYVDYEYTLEAAERAIRNYTYDETASQFKASLDGIIPIGRNVGGTDKGLNEDDNDYIEVMFEEPMCAFRWEINKAEIGGDINSMTIWFWDGNQYVQAQNIYDTIKNDVGGTANYYMLERGGIQFFEIPQYSADATAYTGVERESEINGVRGYKYKITWTRESGQHFFLTLILDQFTGVPRYREIKELYLFPFMYKNRAMWGNSLSDKEYNRVDFSKYSSPDTYNGEDASGTSHERSLRFGDNRELTSAIEVYGIYGDTADTLALFFKENETYILTGDNPETFRIFTLSTTIGNPAPLSLASTASILNKDNASISTNVVLWISNKGPCMYIGNTIYAIPGLEPYFDPNDALYLGASYIKEARGWCDPIYSEYNVIVPNGTGNTDKIWFVYDLVRHKWFRKKPTSDFPSGAIIIEDSNGNKYAYGYCSTGYLMRLDNGLLWSAENKIVNVVKSADMVLSGSLWHESTVRQLRILHEHNPDGVITVRHYIDGNTAPVQGIVSNGGAYYRCNVTHVSGTFSTDLAAGYWTALTYATSGAAWVTATRYEAMPAEVTMAETNSYRYKHYLYNLSHTGFSHSFEITTDNCTAYKPKLLGWGLTFDAREDLGSLSS